MGQWILLMIAGVMTGVFFLLYQKIKYGPRGEGAAALGMKCQATLCCAFLAVWGAVSAPAPGKGMLAAGLIICAVADVLLAIRFLPGMGCFALGHVCYCIAYCQAAVPDMENWLVFLGLMGGIGAAMLWAKKHIDKKMVLPVFGYGLVLALMVSLAIGKAPLLIIGALLFAVSDGMLAGRIVLKIQGKTYDYACLGCYYLAQLLIGASAIF